MSTPKHLMIDIETLSTQPNAAILSIEALFFDPETLELGETLHLHIIMKSSATYGEIDPETVKWWLQQPEASRLDAIKGTEITLLGALSGLDDFIISHADPYTVQVWSKSPSFDLNIIKNAYTRFNRNCPWHYRNERDVRTAIDIATQQLHMPTESLEIQHGTQHTALDDATTQALQILAIYENCQ